MVRPEAGLVFRPTLEELRTTSFEDYVTSIEPQLARVGICKIVAPAGWTPRAAGYSNVDFTVPFPVRQQASGARGLYRTCLMEERALRVAGRGGFAELASAPAAQAPGGPDTDVDVRRSVAAQRDVRGAPASRLTHPAEQTLERSFWKHVTYNPPLYAADVEGSLFDRECEHWNVGNLGTLLTRTLATIGARIPGVTSPYLYWGSWRALFAWHTEDYDLYSVNYLHYGAPKTWYCIAPTDRGRFERAAAASAPELFRECPEFLRHKELLLSPALLRSLGIPFTRITQRAREFVITAPAAYHAGFNHGLNCAESTNFGTAAWVPIGAKAKSCNCQGDTVHIDMRIFGALPPPPCQRGRRRRVEEDDDEEAAAEGEGDEVPNGLPAVKRERLVFAPAVAFPTQPPLCGALPPPASAEAATRISMLGSAASALPLVWKLAGTVVRAASET
jgi:jumonji domain-containing protein 2